MVINPLSNLPAIFDFLKSNPDVNISDNTHKTKEGYLVDFVSGIALSESNLGIMRQNLNAYDDAFEGINREMRDQNGEHVKIPLDTDNAKNAVGNFHLWEDIYNTYDREVLNAILSVSENEEEFFDYINQIYDTQYVHQQWSEQADFQGYGDFYDNEDEELRPNLMLTEQSIQAIVNGRVNISDFGNILNRYGDQIDLTGLTNPRYVIRILQELGSTISQDDIDDCIGCYYLTNGKHNYFVDGLVVPIENGIAIMPNTGFILDFTGLDDRQLCDLLRSESLGIVVTQNDIDSIVQQNDVENQVVSQSLNISNVIAENNEQQVQNNIDFYGMPEENIKQIEEIYGRENITQREVDEYTNLIGFGF